jgi:hypothetical protein
MKAGLSPAFFYLPNYIKEFSKKTPFKKYLSFLHTKSEIISQSQHKIFKNQDL